MVDESLDHKKVHEYELMVEVGCGVGLPELADGEAPYKICAKIGGSPFTTDKAKQSTKGFSRWSVRLKSSKDGKDNLTRFKTPKSTVEELGDVFVYLKNEDGQNICYWRGPAKQFLFDPVEYELARVNQDVDKISEMIPRL